MAKGAEIGERREIPGLKSEELNALWAEYVPKAVFRTAPIFVARGQGARVTDIDGNEYLDFAGGICVLNLGHCNPKVVAAVNDQAGKLMNHCVHTAMHEPYLKLAHG